MKNKGNIKEILQLAGTYISVCIGSGFATGQEIMQFFSAHGMISILSNTICMGIMAYCGASLFGIGNEKKLKSSNDIFTYLCGKHIGKLFKNFMPLFFFCSFVIMLSGAGASISEYYGISKNLGSFILAIITLCSVLLGINKVISILGNIGPVIAIISIGVGLVTISRNIDSFYIANEIIGTLNLTKAIDNWWMTAIIYSGLNLIIATPFLVGVGATAKNKTNCITQIRFLLHGNPLLADWVTRKIGDEWITDLSQIKKLAVYADDELSRQEFMQIKYQNKLRLAAYIKEHNGIDVDPRSIFDVQVKRLHEYKRQLLNILHVMYLYNQIKAHPEMDFYPRTFIFGAKAAAGYKRAKLTIKLINNVANVINNDRTIDGRLKVVFIENYRVSNAEIIFAAADVSEQISTASKEASGTGNMKFMLNGAMTLGTMDGANVEIVNEVGEENAVIFGLSADEVIKYQNEGGYNPQDIFNNDQEIRQVLMQLINGFYSPENPELFRDIYNSLLYDKKPDVYFILKDFRSYAEAHKKIEAKYRDSEGWARSVMLNTACSGKFSSDRTIEEYVRDIWKLDKVKVEL